jgi:hypothetical protein
VASQKSHTADIDGTLKKRRVSERNPLEQRVPVNGVRDCLFDGHLPELEQRKASDLVSLTDK